MVIHLKNKIRGLNLSVCPDLVIKLTTNTFFAFEASIDSLIPLTRRLGKILVYKSPGPKTITSADFNTAMACGFAGPFGFNCRCLMFDV